MKKNKKKINILGLCDYMEQGGMETYYNEIMDKYDKVHFVYWTILPNFGKIVRKPLLNVKIEKLFNYKLRGKTIKLFWKLKYASSLRKFKKRKSEKWFLDNSSWWTIYFIPKCFFKNNDIYLFQHNRLFRAYKLPLMVKFIKLNLLKKFNMCNKIHNISKYDIKIWKAVFPQINTSLFSYQSIIPKSPIPYGLFKNKTNDILFIGRDDPVKRLDKFISIIKYYRNNNKKISARIVGKKVKNICSYNNLDRVSLFNIIKSSKYLIITSEREGQALIIMEALSQNTQVIIYSESVDFKPYINIDGIYFAHNIEKISKIIDNWIFIDMQKTIILYKKKYGYFENNGYI